MMIKSINKFSKKGQALTELALSLPIFVFILLGIMDFGWFFFQQLALINGAREAARYAVVGNGCSLAESRARQASIVELDDVWIVVKNPETDETIGTWHNGSVVSGNPDDRTIGYIVQVIVRRNKSFIGMTSSFSKLFAGTEQGAVEGIVADASFRIE